MSAKRVLAIGAHPDDIELGCGGTLLKLSQKGYKISYLSVTSGDSGSKDIPKAELTLIREAEARAAAKILKCEHVDFLRFPDGLTGFTRDMKLQVINIIRKTRPHIIFTHSSTDQFPDHKVVHRLVMSAISAAGGSVYPDARGKPWPCPNVFGYEVWYPLNRVQLAVDITRFMSLKQKILKCHKSQMENFKYDVAFEGLAKYRGIMTGTGLYAEAFEVLGLAQETLESI